MFKPLILLSLSVLSAQTVVSTYSTGMPVSRSVKEFGAVGDGTTNDSTALASAASWVSGGQNRTLLFPCGRYLLTSGIAITSPATLVGENCATIVYSGSGDVITLGVGGLAYETLQSGLYRITGLRFTGSSSNNTVLKIKRWITNVQIDHNVFENFPTGTGVAINAEGDQWSLRIQDNLMDGSDRLSGAAKQRRFLYMSSSTNLNSSQLLMTGNTITAYSSAYGVKIRGAHARVIGNKIEGFLPNVWIDNDSNNMSIGAIVDSNYFEITSADSDTTPCVGYSGNTSYTTISKNYCNVHNADFLNLAPFFGNMDETADTFLQYNSIENNTVAQLKVSATQVPVVRFNLTVVSQPGNTIKDTRVNDALTSGQYSLTNLAQLWTSVSDEYLNGLTLRASDNSSVRWQVSKQDAPAMTITGVGSYPSIVGQTAGGTVASKSAVSSGAVLGEFSVFGWNGTAYKGGAGIRVKASETFGASAGGSYMQIAAMSAGASGDWRSQIPVVTIAPTKVGIGTYADSPATTLHVVNWEGSSGLTVQEGPSQSTNPLLQLLSGVGATKFSVYKDGSVYLGAGVVFASLGTPTNGTLVYCPDCTKATPCGSGGSGAIAKRINGAWDCD